MKKFEFCAILFLLVAGGSAVRAAEYAGSVSGSFIVITQVGGLTENNVVSIRRPAVMSVQLNNKKVILTTYGVDALQETSDKMRAVYKQPTIYVFDNDTNTDAKALFDFIMKQVAS